ncbi:MAG: alpha/beta hydrolase [Bryobacteraceae bacterium]
MTRTRTLALLIAAAIQAAAQDASVPRDGFSLYYRVSGTGTPIVMLSGGPGVDVDYLAPVAERLPPSFSRVLLEQRGTGRSRLSTLTPANMNLQLVVEDVEALRVHLKQERLLLFGHSWGGMLAMSYAAAYPRRVDKLLLVGPGGMNWEYQKYFGDNIRMRLRPEDLEAERYWLEAPRRGVDPDKALLERQRAIVPGYFFDRAKGLAHASQFVEGSFHGAAFFTLAGDLSKNYDVREALKTFGRPVLIVQGYQDPVGEVTADETHALIKSSRLHYLHKCGHFPWVEQPEEFYRIVAAFLAERSER